MTPQKLSNVNRDCDAIATVEICRVHGLRSRGRKRRAPQDDGVSFVVSQRIVVVYFVETSGWRGQTKMTTAGGRKVIQR
jgi:hypothetical protein